MATTSYESVRLCFASMTLVMRNVTQWIPGPWSIRPRYRARAPLLHTISRPRCYFAFFSSSLGVPFRVSDGRFCRPRWPCPGIQRFARPPHPSSRRRFILSSSSSSGSQQTEKRKFQEKSLYVQPGSMPSRGETLFAEYLHISRQLFDIMRTDPLDPSNAVIGCEKQQTRPTGGITQTNDETNQCSDYVITRSRAAKSIGTIGGIYARQVVPGVIVPKYK